MINPIKQFITLDGIDFFEDTDVIFTYNENYGTYGPYSKSKEFQGRIIFPKVSKQNLVLLCSKEATKIKTFFQLEMFSKPDNLHPALLLSAPNGGQLRAYVKLKVNKTTDIPNNYISFIHNINPVNVVSNKKELLLSYTLSNFITCCGSRLIYINSINQSNINKQDYNVEDLFNYLFLSEFSSFYVKKFFYNLTIFLPKVFNLDISSTTLVKFLETADTILYINKQSKND